MKNKKYIVPETVIAHVPPEQSLLAGTIQGEKGAQSGKEKINWGEGDLDDGEEVAAKRHSLWDDSVGDSTSGSWVFYN